MTRTRIGRTIITLPDCGAGIDAAADRRRARLLAEQAWRAAANENTDMRVPVIAEIKARLAGREPRRVVFPDGGGLAGAWPAVAHLLARLRGTFRSDVVP